MSTDIVSKCLRVVPVTTIYITYKLSIERNFTKQNDAKIGQNFTNFADKLWN